MLLSFYSVLILCELLSCCHGFMPTRGSAVLETDYTMEDIIRIGMSKVTEGETGAGFELDDVGSREDAISEIVRYCNMVDRVQQGNPAWSFADEQIIEGHRLLVTLRDRLLQIVSIQRPNYKAARETLGQIFHLQLKFYSNTNWVELGHTDIYRNLGIPDRPMLPVAPLSQDTCVACGEAVHRPCKNNILADKVLTSGYFGQKQKVSYPEDSSEMRMYGKCRHGGSNDGGGLTGSVPGGINKQSESQEYSPHYFLHKNASMLAIQHVRFYLFDKVYGLYRLVGDELFNQLIQADSDQTFSVYVDVKNETTKQEVVKALHNSEIHVLNITSLKNACLQTEHTIIVIRYNTVNQGHEPWQCDIRDIRFYDIQVLETDNNSESRQRRALGGLDIYHLIADTSGGTVYETTKDNIAAVVDIIKESVSTKPPLTVLKFRQLDSSSNEFDIPIDNLIQNLTIKVQGSSSTVPSMFLYRPSGVKEQFSNSSVGKQQILGTKLRVIHIYNPTPGIWKIKRASSVTVDVDVTASTDLQFSYQFMQPGPGGFGDYPLVGRPIAGENTTVQVSVPLVDKVASADHLLLVDRNGKVVYNSSLQNIGGRRGRSLFKSHIIVPTKEFEVAIEGKDKSGNTFRRLDPKITSALAIQLEVLPSGTLYIKQSITIPYRVRNVGARKTSIQVSITDDKGFAQSPTSKTFTVSTNGIATGSFVLKGGSVKGETTTVTISAKAAGTSNNKVQFNVQRITVEEKIIRVIDTKAPVCNVTSTKGKCDFGADICQCSKQTWQMSAIVGDDGDGMQSVFASGAGQNSSFTKDVFNVGHTLSKGVIHTTLSADCCHQQAKITVVDLAGNVGLCDVVITPGFVAPDPKLCISPSKTKPVKTNANVTTITCNITNIFDTCNGSLLSTGKACNAEFWSTEASLGDEGFGRVQVAAVNAGRNAKLTKHNNTVTLRTDCCHTDVYINAVDIAGHTGQCHAKIKITGTPNRSSGQSENGAPPIGIIAGGATGGVVVAGAIAGLVYYMKTKTNSGKIGIDANAVSPAT